MRVFQKFNQSSPDYLVIDMVGRAALIFAICALVSAAILFYKTDNLPPVIAALIFALGMLLVKFLTRKGHTIAARILFAVIPVAIMVIMPIASKVSSAENMAYVRFITPKILLVVLLGFPLLVFRFKSAWHFLWVYGTGILILGSMDALHGLFGVGVEQSVHDLKQHTFSNITAILAYTMLVFSFLFLRTQLISSFKKLEEARAHAENALSVRSEFLARMSHDMRTPLNAIMGFTTLMQRETITESQSQKLELLNDSSLQLLSIIDNVLDFRNIEQGKVELCYTPISLKPLTDSIVEQAKILAKNRIEISACIDPNLPHEIVFDSLRLYQVLTNLMANAVKYTSRGSITLIAEKQKSSPETCVIKWSIKDTGCGISKTDQQNIFQTFNQGTKTNKSAYQGTGLGLSIAQAVVNLFDSEISVVSELGKGTTFSFETRSAYNLLEKNGSSQPVPKDIKSMKILCAEDNVLNALVISQILEKAGAQVKVAENGKIAVSYFEADQFDAILMDLNMPVMDGFEATRIIREKDSRIPIFALTASDTVHERAKAKNVGMNDYMSKPFDPKRLIAMLQTGASQNARNLDTRRRAM